MADVKAFARGEIAMTGRTYKRLFAIGITITLLAGTSWGVERTWTDTTGKFSVTAELEEVRGNIVLLRRQDGKQFQVPLEKLCAEDQQFLTQHTAENPFQERQSLPVPQARSLDPPQAVAPFGSDQAKAHQKAWADHLGTPVFIKDSIGVEFNLIPPGLFTRGACRVKITQPFYLGAYEVTQQQYEQVIGKNPSLTQDANKPVNNINWNDAVAFCGVLRLREGVEYRLPTEAEWEYACRAGTTTAYSFGDDVSQLGEYAWYLANSENTTHPVGEKKPNAWGLYDMHGNVWEWCQDWYAPYDSLKVVRDPTGPTSGVYRVLRGGAFNDHPEDVRAANRLSNQPDNRYPNAGFRLAMTIPLSP